MKAALFADGLEPYEILNMRNNHPEQLMDMIQYLDEALGIEPKMKMLPMQAGDVPVTFADITHAQEKLGYVPTTSLQGGLKQFVDWYQRMDIRNTILRD